MKEQLSDPLTPSEVDLRDFGFMPLDVQRLVTSETWIDAIDDPRIGHAAMSLWCEAWHQVPAGSLPDNDKVLYRLSMCPNLKEWQRVRDRVMSGWVKALDGRLYHAVVAEKACESWAKKLAQRARTAAATEARERKRREKEDLERAPRDEQRNDSRNVERDEQRNESRDVYQGTVKGELRDSKGTGIKEQERGERAPAQSRAAQIAIRLIGAGIKATSINPDVIAFADKGVTDEQVDAAVQTAVHRLGKVPNSPGYLREIVDEIMNPQARPVRQIPNRQEALEARNAAVADAWMPPEMRDAAG
jgi:hypothetical protein